MYYPTKHQNFRSQGKNFIQSTQGKYRRRLYCDHVTEMLCHRHYLDDTFTLKPFFHMITKQAASILALC